VGTKWEQEPQSGIRMGAKWEQSGNKFEQPGHLCRAQLNTEPRNILGVLAKLPASKNHATRFTLGIRPE